MSPRLRPEPFAADHERARTLAASSLDGPLGEADAGWLTDHLGWCRPCRAVAVEYDEQRIAIRALRHDQPQAPRDLWARTAAAIEADPVHARRGGRRRPAGLGLVPVTGVLVVAVVVGAGLLNGTVLFPSVGPTGGEGVSATPITLAGSDIQVLSHAQDGSLEISTGNVDQVCPVGADSCGLNQQLDVTQLAGLGSGSELDAIISPDRGEMVVVTRGEGSKGVFVVPVKARGSVTSTAPAATATPGTPAAGSASPAATATPRAHASASAVGTPLAPPESPSSSGGPASAPPSEEPAASGSPSGVPSASESGSPEATPDEIPTPSDKPPASPPEATPGSGETASPTASEQPAGPTPSVEVTPGPDGAIEIARDVSVEGSIASYSPDGTRFAFSARPADGSAGPDVYVWRVGDREARAVTVDHGSLFSGWLGARPLVSRVVDGSPRTFVLDLATGTQRLAHDDPMWRPTVAPGHRVATWWDGTVRRSDDGKAWQPDHGRLVLGAWPDGGSETQVLADGPISDWDVRWDDAGRMLAVWIAGDGPRHVGRLSLYSVDPDTGRADLASPKLADAPAFAGYSLKPGRLAWSAPKDGSDTTVELLAWSGNTIIGRLSMPAQGGATVVR